MSSNDHEHSSSCNHSDEYPVIPEDHGDTRALNTKRKPSRYDRHMPAGASYPEDEIAETRQELIADDYDDDMMMIQVSSGGLLGGDFARITINKAIVKCEKNESGHYRGLHVVLVNSANG